MPAHLAAALLDGRLLLQGIGRLTLVLQQFALAAAAVGTLTLLEAATTFPSIVKVAAVLCLGFTGARLCLRRVWQAAQPSQVSLDSLKPVSSLMYAGARAAAVAFLSWRHPEAQGGRLHAPPCAATLCSFCR